MNDGGTQQSTRYRRAKRAGALGVTVGVLASLITFGMTSADHSDGHSADANVNPDLTAGCGLDVVVLLDESASISSPIGGGSQVGTMQDAVGALVGGLAGTGSRMRFVEFSTNARDVSVPGFGVGYTEVTSAYADGVDDYMAPAGSPNTANADSYNPGSAGARATNWEAGLKEAWTTDDDTPGTATQPDGIPQLVIFITDGNPTTYGTGIGGVFGNDNVTNDEPQWSSTFAAMSVDHIRALQDANAHVLAIGVGDAFSGANAANSQARLRNLVEPNGAQVRDNGSQPPLESADVWLTSFGDLTSALGQLGGSLCGIDLTKTVRADQPVHNGTNWSVTYDLVVTNKGPATEYTLSDTPAFGAGASNLDITISGATLPGGTIEHYVAGTPIPGIPIAAEGADGSVHTYVVTVTFDVATGMSGEARDCELTNENGTGTLNHATVTHAKYPPVTDDDCAEIPAPPDGDIEITKVDQFTNGDPIEGADGHVVPGQLFQYSITVQNTDDEQSLEDVNMTDSIPVELTVVYPLAFDDEDWDCSASSGSSIDCDFQHVLAAGATTSPVVVPVRLAADFGGDEIQNTAFTTAKVVVPPEFEAPEVDDNDPEVTPVRSLNGTLIGSDCESDVPIVAFTINPIGFTPSGKPTVTLFSLDPDHLGEQIDSFEVDSLSGSFLYPGAAVDENGVGTDWPGWKLEDGTWVLDDSDAYLRSGLRVVISVNPTFEQDIAYPPATIDCPGGPPVDLALTKTDNGATPSPGDTFQYQITVTNVGGTDPDPQAPITVTDILPPEFTWATVPANCDIDVVDSQRLTCDLDPSALPAVTADTPAGSVTLTATARVNDDTDPSEVGYQNLAWVDSPQDPVCDPELTDCDPEAPPACPEVALAERDSQQNNVDCELTPVPPTPPVDLALTKTDSGATPFPGDSFQYQIEVSNVGATNPAVNPTVTDILPAEFQWVTPAPAGCSFSGQTMTCTLQASNLKVGQSVTITATAMVRPTTLAADPGYVNLAWVDSPEDPVCVGECDPQTPPTCPTSAAPNNNVDCEPTPVLPKIEATLLTADCVIDAPWIKYTINPVGFAPSGGATITLRRKDNNAVVATFTNLPLTGQILYPGAAVDAQGNGTDWPGWKFQNNQWVLDNTDAYLRSGLNVTIEVNPTTAGTVTYPAASSACADPEQVRSNPPPNPQQPTPTTSSTVPPRTQPLPPTGSSTTRTGVIIAMFLVACGAGVMLITRRRHTADEQS